MSPGSGLPPGLSELLERFEHAWRSGASPRIEAFLPVGPNAVQGPARQQLLEELIALDLEYRWRRKAPADAREAPARLHLEDYVQHLPELGPWGRLGLNLIAVEYRVRQRWGDRPSHAEYLARFAPRGPQLRPILQRIDAELVAEFGSAESSAIAGSNTVPAQPVVSGRALIAALRQCGVLGPARMKELERAGGQARDVRDLARILLERDWLTPFQINQVLQGRAAELMLGPYVLLERLGEGGMGQVFKAWHQKLNRLVALKTLRKELLQDREVVRRFLREVRIVRQLDHPNVVRAVDAGQVGQTHVLAMEYIEGVDLARLVKRSGPLPAAQACDYVRQAALGLQHAHLRGLVHRDIKPPNLLLAQGGGTQSPGGIVVKILDMGLARLQSKSDGELTSMLTPPGASLMGTPDYLAPEQATNFHGADIRADIYSLGCTFYYMLTGQPPFPGGMLAEKLLRHQQTPPPPVEKLRADLPADLPPILEKMLAKRPEHRYQSPAEVANALASLNGHPARRRWWSVSSRRWPRMVGRRTRVAAGFLVGLLLVASCLALVAFHSSRPPAAANTQSVNSTDASRAPGPPWRHAGPVRTAVISPDGKLVASAGGDSTIRLWDLQTGQLQAALQFGSVPIIQVAFAPDSRTLISVGQSEKAAILWDLNTNKVRKRLSGHGGPINCVAFSHDGKTVATGSDDSTGKLWDSATGKELASLTDHTGPVLALLIPPGQNNRVVLTGSHDQTIKMWYLQSGKLRTTMKGHAGSVTSLAIAPGENNDVIASGSSDSTVKLWHANNGSEIGTLKGHTGPVRSVAFAADQKRLASGGDDHSVRLWDWKTSARGQRTTLDGHAGPVWSVSFSPVGATLVSGSADHTVKVWDADTGLEMVAPVPPPQR